MSHEPLPVRRPAVAGTFYPSDERSAPRAVAPVLRRRRAAAAVGTRADGARGAARRLRVLRAGRRQRLPAAGTRTWDDPARRAARARAIGSAFRRDRAERRRRVGRRRSGRSTVDADASRCAGSVPVRSCRSTAAHADEHCLEVQLPFLQTVLDEFVGDPARRRRRVGRRGRRGDRRAVDGVPTRSSWSAPTCRTTTATPTRSGSMPAPPGDRRSPVRRHQLPTAACGSLPLRGLLRTAGGSAPGDRTARPPQLR